MATAYDVGLIEVIPCGEEFATFRFQRPEGFAFRAGQYLLLSLETEQGVERKPFTVCSAPHDPHLEITTRLSGSPFKRTLGSLAPLSVVQIAGPAGKLLLEASWTTLGFLVGGVGITPARSMLRDLVHRGVGIDALVFYGNRSGACIPFFDEMDAMQANGVTTVHVLERADADWDGPVGFITSELVAQRLAGRQASERRWVVAGPPIMVEAMEGVLDALRVPGSVRMVERFDPRPVRRTVG